ncbi:MAG: DNA ligase LigA-related protein, partial [bacterium]
MSETDPLVETDLKTEVPEALPDLDTLSKSEVQEEAEQLREAIRHHDRLYYEKNRPAISDAAYDRLFGRLQEIEEAFPDLRTEDSPTRRVGSPPVDRLERVEHRAPMLSLDAVLEAEGMRDFDRFVRDQAGERVRYVLEPKFDGFSVEIVYRDGVFEHGSTRGDGEVGEDISRNLQTLRAVPLRLESPDEAPSLLAIRGEVLLRKSGFQELNKRRIEAGKEPFANPRNAAAGMMRQLDSSKLVGLPFDIVFYELLAAEGDTPKTHEELLEALSDQGLVTDPHRETTTDPADIERFHQRMLDERESFEVEIDGVVIKLDD